jgi:hypothetical protein
MASVCPCVRVVSHPGADPLVCPCVRVSLRPGAGAIRVPVCACIFAPRGRRRPCIRVSVCACVKAQRTQDPPVYPCVRVFVCPRKVRGNWERAGKELDKYKESNDKQTITINVVGEGSGSHKLSGRRPLSARGAPRVGRALCPAFPDRPGAGCPRFVSPGWRWREYRHRDHHGL